MREAGGASGLGWCLIGAERETERADVVIKWNACIELSS